MKKFSWSSKSSNVYLHLEYNFELSMEYLGVFCDEAECERWNLSTTLVSRRVCIISTYRTDERCSGSSPSSLSVCLVSTVPGEYSPGKKIGLGRFPVVMEYTKSMVAR